MCEKAKEWAKSKHGLSEEAAERFGQEYNIDDPMYLDDNYCECASYFVGDHRCSCGNRRVTIEYSKKLDGTFYFDTNVW